MKITLRRLMLLLLNGIVGYIVIQFVVSCSEVFRATKAFQEDSSKRAFPEENAGNSEASTNSNTRLFQDDWWIRMNAGQEERKARLRMVCSALYNKTVLNSQQLASQKTRLRPLIVNERFHFIYSIVYKVGSTNWERVIVQDLEGHQNVPNQMLYSHKALQWMGRYDEKQVKEYLDSYTKFIFVRNPLSRILSGYRDKFVEHHNSVFSKLARRIIKQYRRDTSGEGEQQGENVTFTEFLSYLIDSAENRANPHWKPIYVQNSPCDIDFDIIGRLEDASDDIPFVLKRVGIWNMTSYGKGPPRKNTDSDLIRKYYSQVPLKLLQDLYKVYEPDFHMFGYDMPLFL